MSRDNLWLSGLNCIRMRRLSCSSENPRQENLWGINLYTERTGSEMIEFDSMINLRPRQNNRSRGVEDEAVRERIVNVVNKLVK